MRNRKIKYLRRSRWISLCMVKPSDESLLDFNLGVCLFETLEINIYDSHWDQSSALEDDTSFKRSLEEENDLFF